MGHSGYHTGVRFVTITVVDGRWKNYFAVRGGKRKKICRPIENSSVRRLTLVVFPCISLFLLLDKLIKICAGISFCLLPKNLEFKFNFA
jgi:hypothetical protein